MHNSLPSLSEESGTWHLCSIDCAVSWHSKSIANANIIRDTNANTVTVTNTNTNQKQIYVNNTLCAVGDATMTHFTAVAGRQSKTQTHNPRPNTIVFVQWFLALESQSHSLLGDSEIWKSLDLDFRIVPFLIWKDTRWDTSTSVRKSQNTGGDAAFVMFMNKAWKHTLLTQLEIRDSIPINFTWK